MTLMAAAPPLVVPDQGPDPSEIDQRVLLHDMRWTDFEVMLALRGERSVPRLYFMDGTIELMTPSHFHEGHKKLLARLLEAWADELGIELSGYGSWTLKRPELERGAEPDECYVLGVTKDRPDLAIEVEWTRGGLGKLKLYAGLGVPELWILTRSLEIHVHRLHGDAYQQVDRSELFPQLDVQWLAGFLGAASQTQAVRAMRAAVRSP